MKKYVFVLLLTFIVASSYAQKATTIYIVRHAEKQTTNPQDKNPDLTTEGEERAVALKNFLKGKNINYIFSSNYNRTKLTAQPTSLDKNIPITIYNVSKPHELISEIKDLGEGKNILIVGHSNTIIKMINDLGAPTSITELADDDYDFIFELKKRKDKSKLKVAHFGSKHHSTIIK